MTDSEKQCEQNEQFTNNHHRHASTTNQHANFFDDIRRYREIDERRHQEQEENNANSRTKDGNKWSVLLFGQVVALAAASNSAASYALEYNMKVFVPITLMLCMYLLLATPHVWYLWWRRRKRKEKKAARETPQQNNSNKRPYRLPFTNLNLSAPWWAYLAVALLDVESNYLTMLSFKYTSLSSSTLLNSISVPTTMIFSMGLLARVFRMPHYVGACLCLLGGTMTVWADVGVVDSLDDDPNAPLTPTTTLSTHPHTVRGDIFAVLAAILYGVGDTVGELFVKHVDRVEYLGMLGLFGAMITAIQIPFLEWDALMALPSLVHWDEEIMQWWIVVGLIVVWFLVSVVFFYIGTSLFYLAGDATLLNLSLRTSNLWAILFDVVAEREPPSSGFYGALLLMATGMIIYEVCGTSSTTRVAAGLQLDNVVINERKCQSDERQCLVVDEDASAANDTYGSTDTIL
uniref:EamA domain-containing protein n=1 Tax=Grammatophora oceanica TaxID=210454 RepID=A0A7S1V0K6_9STRA|mmetsp:Transcript_32586/g.48308  ORF Transcript_32586/g.48308 Transcript_32586/m.48308 type:complete len:460 (+) Transcript_32586:118-1497(+)